MNHWDDARLGDEFFIVRIDAKGEPTARQSLHELRPRLLRELHRDVQISRRPSRPVDDRCLCSEEVPPDLEAGERSIEVPKSLNDR